MTSSKPLSTGPTARHGRSTSTSACKVTGKNSSKKESFKSQLKRQIMEIKRAKKMEEQRKEQEKRALAKEAARKQRDEERKKQEEERQRKREEKERQAEERRNALKQQEAYRLHVMNMERRKQEQMQMLHPHFAPQSSHGLVPNVTDWSSHSHRGISAMNVLSAPVPGWFGASSAQKTGNTISNEQSSQYQMQAAKMDFPGPSHAGQFVASSCHHDTIINGHRPTSTCGKQSNIGIFDATESKSAHAKEPPVREDGMASTLTMSFHTSSFQPHIHEVQCNMELDDSPGMGTESLSNEALPPLIENDVAATPKPTNQHLTAAVSLEKLPICQGASSATPTVDKFQNSASRPELPYTSLPGADWYRYGLNPATVSNGSRPTSTCNEPSNIGIFDATKRKSAQAEALPVREDGILSTVTSSFHTSPFQTPSQNGLHNLELRDSKGIDTETPKSTNRHPPAVVSQEKASIFNSDAATQTVGTDQYSVPRPQLPSPQFPGAHWYGRLNPVAPQHHPHHLYSHNWFRNSPRASLHVTAPVPFVTRARQPASNATLKRRRTTGAAKHGFMLHTSPLEHPSPYSKTHTLFATKLQICKKPGESFGVIVKYEIQSALVDPPLVQSRQEEENESKGSPKETTGAVLLVGPRVEKESPAPVSVGSGQPIEDIQKPTVVRTAENTTRKRRRRRRRAFFGVMVVSDASKQYLNNNGVEAERRLIPGDIILQINDQQTCGRPFKSACALFATSCENDSSACNAGVISCSLLVARRQQKNKPETAVPVETSFSVQKDEAQPSTLIPLRIDPTAHKVVSGEFTEDELESLVKAVLKGFHHNNAMADSAPRFSGGYTGLQRRSNPSLSQKWSQMTLSFDNEMRSKGAQWWEDQWNIEKEKSPPILQEALSNAGPLPGSQRSAMRALPRPAKGCRCGRKDHDYVSDTKCLLYNNLRILKLENYAPTEVRKRNIKSKGLKAVEKAYKDRMIKVLEEQENERIEADFVDKMELLQTEVLGKALFAPSLTAMVLSTVAELQHKAKSPEKPDSITAGESGTTRRILSDQISSATSNNDSDSSDDDDVPLVALAKPKISSSVNNDDSASMGSLSHGFLVDLLQHISDKWGEVFFEPSHLDWAWRWETSRLQIENDSELKLRNPRQPGTPSFENVRFALQHHRFSPSQRLNSIYKTDSRNGQMGELKKGTEGRQRVERDESTDTSERNLIDGVALLVHLVSPQVTGLYHELWMLLHEDLISVNEIGCAVLNKDWFVNANVNLLREHQERWSKQADPSNKFCIHRTITESLEREWEYIPKQGWAFKDDPTNIVHSANEYSEWRQAFDEVHENVENDHEGIGQFGI